MATEPVTDSTFDQDVVNANSPVLVDFWAEWCGPCRALAPKLEEIAQEMGEKVRVVKLNVDENPSSAAKYGVRGIPTLILFKGGTNVDQVVGNQSKENIVAMIEKNT